MTLQNRVRPDREIVADPARGGWMGNRGGRLHRPDRTLGSARWVSRRWICCRLDWKGRRRRVMGDGYTELFFLDEATALAAGHRPCFECRREDARRFAVLFGRAAGLGSTPSADEMDARLHPERVGSTAETVTWSAVLADLPTGAMFRLGHTFGLKVGTRVAQWSPHGYGAVRLPPGGREQVEVLTPRTIVAVLVAGYAPQIHASVEFLP